MLHCCLEMLLPAGLQWVRLSPMGAPSPIQKSFFVFSRASWPQVSEAFFLMATHDFKAAASRLNEQNPLQQNRPDRTGIASWAQVYEAFFLLATRDFKAAATLFLEAIATFTTCAACFSSQSLRKTSSIECSRGILAAQSLRKPGSQVRISRPVTQGGLRWRKASEEKLITSCSPAMQNGAVLL